MKKLNKEVLILIIALFVLCSCEKEQKHTLDGLVYERLETSIIYLSDRLEFGESIFRITRVVGSKDENTPSGWLFYLPSHSVGTYTYDGKKVHLYFDDKLNAVNKDSVLIGSYNPSDNDLLFIIRDEIVKYERGKKVRPHDYATTQDWKDN